MEKELLITTLKEKAQVNNLSDRTYDEVATMWLPLFADDAKITDESWGLPVQMLKTMSGQLRHDVSLGIANGKSQWEVEANTAKEKAVSDALATAKAEWELTRKPGQPPVDNTQPDINTIVADAVAKAINGLTGADGVIGQQSKKLDDFITAFTQKEKAQTEADIRRIIRDRLIARGVEEDDYALEITMEKLAIGENPDLEALSAKAEKDYEAIYKRMHKGDGAQPFGGGAGGAGNGQDSKAEFEKFIQQKRAEMEKEANDAEKLRKHMM